MNTGIDVRMGSRTPLSLCVALIFVAALSVLNRHAHAVCGPDAGDCFSDNGTPGCKDIVCCEAVCECDPFCCNVEWDHFCATTGFDPDCLCPETGCGALNTDICTMMPPPCADGDCCEAHDLPAACGDFECCVTVCSQDAFCCDFAWDALCAAAAQEQCAVCSPCGPGAGDCFFPNGSPGCEDIECCEAVCECDSFCCDVEWDPFCATTGFDPDCLCPEQGCGVLNTPECFSPTPKCDGGTGDCCVANVTPGCEDLECCEAVCRSDLFCCDVAWDDICADLAHEQCDICSEPEGCSIGFWKNHTEHWSGYGPHDLFDETFAVGFTPDTNCCEPHDDTGCDDSECEALVCAQDPFCCDTSWDAICASAAHGMCNVCMIADPAPLDIFGDATLLDVISSPSGGRNAQGPTSHHNNLGKQAVAALLNAASSAAYPWSESEVVKAVGDALNEGDKHEMNAVKDELDKMNNLGCPSFNQADISGPQGEPDGMIDTFDLTELIAFWGSVGDDHHADLNNDGVVDTLDLLKVISNWGPAPAEWTE